MLCVVLADNLFLLYTGWELTSITSYLLIGNDHTKTHARAAALHALLVTSFGGLAMLAGFILIGQAAGTYRLSELLAASAARHHGRRRPRAHPPRRVHQVGAVPVPLVAAGGDGRADAGQRLPPLGDDGEGRRVPRRPVRAGVRHHAGSGGRSCSPSAPPRWSFGGLRALRQHDLKLLLAHGTVSQLGFLIVLFGIGTPAATAAGCVMLLAHAVFKAALFMVGRHGRPQHSAPATGGEIPPLDRGWRPFVVVTVASAASMAGIPLLLGFVGQGGRRSTRFTTPRSSARRPCSPRWSPARR